MRTILLLLFYLLQATVAQTSFPISQENSNQQKKDYACGTKGGNEPTGALIKILDDAQISGQCAKFFAETVYDVVIVGAGMTGLAAAKRILKERPETSILILEARGQVGGRIRARSMMTATGDDWVDIGTQFISSDHKEVMDLAAEVGVSFRQQTVCGERSILIEGVRRRKRQLSWSSSMPSHPSFTDVIQSKDAPQLQNQSISEFIQKTSQSPQNAASINRLLQTLYDAPEDNVSALTVALAAASDNATIAEMLLNTGHGTGMLAHGGLFKLMQALAENLLIEYNQKVIGINQGTSPATVMTSSASFLARQVLVTVPPAVASTIIYSPKLDTQFHSFLASYRPAGGAHYFTMTFPSASWRNQSKNGQIIYTSGTGPIAWLSTFDVSQNEQCAPPLASTGLLWGVAHLLTDSIPEERRHQLYIDIVTKAMPTNEKPLDVKDLHFASDPFALGSIAVFRPSNDMDFLKYIKGVNTQRNSLHFASAEFSNISMGLINGAVHSGYAAAEVIVQQLEDSPVTSGNDITAKQLDSPVTEGAKGKVFEYHTSTHYPPSMMQPNRPLDIKIILAPAMYDDSRSSYAYKTSTHYPPGVAMSQSSSPQPTGSTGFKYETSSHYPPTSTIDTTTYKHFSFGNLNSQEPEPSIWKLQRDVDSEEESTTQDPAGPSTTYSYSTSSHYPVDYDKNPKLLPFRHFSMGNMEENEVKEEAPANMVVKGMDQSPETGQQVETSTKFNYRTSSQYPINAHNVKQDEFNHFSMGNAQNTQDTNGATFISRDSVAQLAPRPSGKQQNTAATVANADQPLYNELQQVAQQAPSMDKMTLASQLNSFVGRLLQSNKNTFRR